MKSHLCEKYRLSWLSIVQDSRFNNFSFLILANTEIKNSELCLWLVRGQADPGHTWNKVKVNLILMSFLSKDEGEMSKLTQTQIWKVMVEAQRKSNDMGLWYSEQWRLDRRIRVWGGVIRIIRVSVTTFSLA